MSTPDLSRATWRTSSRSANGGNCVEVALAASTGGHLIAVRDSKNRAGATLAFTPDQWHAFTASARSGTFDCP